MTFMFLYEFIILSIHSLIYWFVHQFTLSFIQPFIHSLIFMPIHHIVRLISLSIYPFFHVFFVYALIIHYLFTLIPIGWYFIYSFSFLQNSGKPEGTTNSFYATSTNEYSKYYVNKIIGHGGSDVLSGKNISLDRYFTSMSIADWILEWHITVTGTIRADRKRILLEME